MYFVHRCGIKIYKKKFKKSVSGTGCVPVVRVETRLRSISVGPESKAVFKLWVESVCYNITQ